MVERVINIPEGVDVSINEGEIIIAGPKGASKRSFDDPRYNKIISMSKDGSSIKVSSESDQRKIKAVVGTIGGHLNNMILGVTRGFRCIMKVHYQHIKI